jgi:hypothetical protein
MKPYALDICTTLSDKFITILKEFPEMDDEEQEANSAIAYTCLVSIQTILDSISSHQDLLAKIEPKLLTLIAFVLESENLDYLEEGTKIFTFISFYQSNISTDMWKLYDMSFFAFDKWAYDFGECKKKKFTHRFFTSF